MDKTLILFAFPKNVLLEIDLATRMGAVKKLLEDIPEIQILSVIGETANKILKTLEPQDDHEPSHLVVHAMRELALVGNDADFDASIIAAVEAFASYGHSGGSASVAIPLLNDLLQFKNISPLTDDPKEWMRVDMGDDACWQNVRNPEAFTNDDCFKEYYLLSEGGSASNPEPKHKTVERKSDISETEG